MTILSRSAAKLLIGELAAAADLRDGMARLAAGLGRRFRVRRVEWWRPSDDGTRFVLELAVGAGRGARTPIPLGPAGVLVLIGGRWPTDLVVRLVPVVRRRWADEQLVQQVARLARRNQGLDDFAALVAHELKTLLRTVHLLDDPQEGLARASELIDAVLEAARADGSRRVAAAPAQSLADALSDLGLLEANVVADLPDDLPLPRAAQRVLLRNLVANAAAAGAHRIEVSAVESSAGWTLAVEDDGGGVPYQGGSGIGLNLCRRLASRNGATLTVEPLPHGGSRAAVALGAAA
jgi:signal transduction histidine kinase